MKRLTLCILLLFFISCNSEDKQIDIPIINTELSEIHYSDLTNTQKLTFYTNYEWSASIEYIGEQSDWLTLSQKNGNKGNFSIDLTASENSLYQKREAKLKINAGSEVKTISISQKHKGAIVLSQVSYDVQFDGAEIVVELKSSVVYEIIIKPEFQSWISDITTKSRGLEDYTHKFSVAQTVAARAGFIVFKEAGALLSDTVRINQSGMESVYDAERKILLELYASTKGESWSANVNWGSDLPVSEWGGISFDENGFVSKIKLNDRNLDGTLPNSLGELRSLKMLDLKGNKLRGVIPASLRANPHFEDFVFHLIRQIDGYGFDLKDVSYKAPAFSATDLNNNAVESKELFAKNELTLLFSWNSTNLPSRLLVYDLYPLFEAYKDKGLGVVGLSTQTESVMKTYIENEKMPWINIHDKESYFTNKLLAKTSIPQVVIVDKQGNIVFDVDKYQSDAIQLLNSAADFIEKTLGKPNPVEYYTSTDMSMDGEVVLLQRAKTEKSANIIFLCDGFVDKDMVAGGKWERVMNETLRHFFSVEPSKTYRDYFNVYAVKAVSKNDVYYKGNRFKNSQTALNVSFGEGTRVIEDAALTQYYAGKTGLDLKKAPITIILNSSRYVGTAYWNKEGASRAYVPIPTVRGLGEEEFREILLHESMGHGFSQLLDEYKTNFMKIPANKIEDFNRNRAMGYGFNLTVDKVNDIPWKKFIGLEGYEMVDVFEGGFLYTEGVWRAEENHCMNNNVPYFNAPSRELFVKRLKNLAGEEYSFEEFLAKDKYEPVTTKSSRGLSPYPFIPLAPPVFVEQ